MSGAGREPGEHAAPVPARTSRDERHERYAAQRDLLFGVFTDSEGSSRPDTTQLIPGDEGPSWEVHPVDRAGFLGFPCAMQQDDAGLHVHPTDGVQEEGDSSGRSSPRDLASIPPEDEGSPSRNSPPPSPRSGRGGVPAESGAPGSPPSPGGGSGGGGGGGGGISALGGLVIPPIPRMTGKYPKFSGREDEDADAHMLSFEMAWMVNSAPPIQATYLMKRATFIPTL